MAKELRAALYRRVSKGTQTTDNQRPDLEAVAERRGWRIVADYEDAAISGAKRRDKRPGLDQMLNDARRRKFDVVMVWAIDRLGRSLHDLLNTIEELKAYGCDLYIDQNHIDTTTPAGRLLFHVTGAFAEFEREMTKQRIHAGLARARAQGKKLGRPVTDRRTETAIRHALAAGKGMRKVAREVGVGTGTVQRIAAEMKAEGAAQ